jgi:hypothetical protein
MKRSEKLLISLAHEYQNFMLVNNITRDNLEYVLGDEISHNDINIILSNTNKAISDLHINTIIKFFGLIDFTFTFEIDKIVDKIYLSKEESIQFIDGIMSDDCDYITIISNKDCLEINPLFYKTLENPLLYDEDQINKIIYAEEVKDQIIKLKKENKINDIYPISIKMYLKTKIDKSKNWHDIYRGNRRHLWFTFYYKSGNFDFQPKGCHNYTIGPS